MIGGAYVTILAAVDYDPRRLGDRDREFVARSLKVRGIELLTVPEWRRGPIRSVAFDPREVMPLEVPTEITPAEVAAICRPKWVPRRRAA